MKKGVRACESVQFGDEKCVKTTGYLFRSKHKPFCCVVECSIHYLRCCRPRFVSKTAKQRPREVKFDYHLSSPLESIQCINNNNNNTSATITTVATVEEGKAAKKRVAEGKQRNQPREREREERKFRVLMHRRWLFATFPLVLHWFCARFCQRVFVCVYEAKESNKKLLQMVIFFCSKIPNKCDCPFLARKGEKWRRKVAETN